MVCHEPEFCEGLATDIWDFFFTLYEACRQKLV